jgi:arginine decarboxylase
MVNIGSTRGSATYLLDVLLRVAEELDERAREQSELARSITAERVRTLVEHFPPLPTFSRFHPAFVEDPHGNTPEGDMRTAFFEAYEEQSCEHLRLDGPLEYAMTAGRTVVSAAFVTPYPPGFPVLVPGQVVSADILNYLKAVDVKEIHGYEPEHGLRVFKDEVLVELVAKREQARAVARKESDRRGEDLGPRHGASATSAAASRPR